MSYTGADVIAEGLEHAGVRHAFAIVSIHNMPILDAINRRGFTQLIDVRHEQAGTHAADGYARATGGIGVMIASTGPGTSNCVTGLYEAAYASSKTLVITGQAATAFYGKGQSYVHEAEQQLPMLRTVVRRAESPRHVDQIAECFGAVVRDMQLGRPQPGALEIPIDLQYEEANPAVFGDMSPVRSVPQADMVARAAELLSTARRRVILAGGGVIAAEAGAALERLAEALDAPVLTTVDGRGALPEDHPLCIGNLYDGATVQKAIRDADVTLAIGTKFAVGVDGRAAALVPPGELIHVDVDPNMIGRTHPATVGVAGDALLAIEGLHAGLDGASPNDSQFNDGVRTAAEGLKAGIRPRLGADVPKMMDRMRAALPRDGLWLRDTTIPAYFYGNQLFPVYEPRTSINPSSGAIGPGLPLAVGAVLGSGRRGLCVHGDGGFMFHATELATAAQYRLPLAIVIFNDSGYGVLRWLQQNRFGRINETDLGKVDFAMMAASMGVPGERVTDLDAFDAAIERAMATDGPYLVDVDMEHFAPYELGGAPPPERRG